MPVSFKTSSFSLAIHLCLYLQFHSIIMEQHVILAMVKWVQEIIIFFFLAIFSKAIGGGAKSYSRHRVPVDNISNKCLSWRLAVEANNLGKWRTVPADCLDYIETYMIGGQYDQDMKYIVEQIQSYIAELVVGDDGMDAWILDVDDTCLSNIFYYKGKRYGCEPFDPKAFKAWVMTEECPAIPAVLELFTMLVDSGFKVFLVTGRDEETLATATFSNLRNQGFIGYERVIFRTPSFRGKSAVIFKSEIRKQLMEEGYRIWGNVGDQWTDLQGECLGNRTFKLPNPMYCVP